MKALASTLLVTLAIAGSASATCPGDINLDQQTTVDEIVSAVNAALNGCPEPVGCPLRFDEPTGDDACFFVGRYNPLCGFSDLEATFSSDGQEVIVSFFNPDIDFFATVVDDGIAEIFAWQDVADPPQDPVDLEGEILLSDPPREALTVNPFEIPFAIEDCDFERYEGRFGEVLTFTAAAAKGSVTPARAGDRLAAAKARLASQDSRLSELKELAKQRQGDGDAGRVRRSTTPGKPRVELKSRALP